MIEQRFQISIADRDGSLLFPLVVRNRQLVRSLRCLVESNLKVCVSSVW